MHIIVIGIGGVGGYFGGRLIQAGHRVDFVARGRHGKAIADKGLRVKSIEGGFTVHPHRVHKDLDTIGAPDLIILGTKLWQLRDIAPRLKDHLGKHTAVLPLQNGVSSIEVLQEHLPERHILGGFCKIISRIESDGVVNHFAFKPQVIFGETDGSASQRALTIEKLFESAGIATKLSRNIQLDAWRKFLFICVLSGMGGLTRQEVGVMREDPGVRELMLAAALEIVGLAKKKHIGLNENDITNTFNAIDQQEYHSTSSVQRDLMAGRPSELDDFNGYVVREAARYQTPVPVNKFIYYCLRPMELKARNAS